LADALRAALARIDPRQAEAFCLVALEGFPNTRAAELLGTTPNNVAVLLHRARAALRQRLRAFDPAAPGGSS
jgi:RNA polymerase sigma factor (sigma-70 family)